MNARIEIEENKQELTVSIHCNSNMLLFHSYKPILLLLLLLLLIFLSPFGIASFTSPDRGPIFNGNYCPNNATYQSTAAFQNNLIPLISSLVSNASEGRDGYRTVFGSGTTGFFYCRGDAPSSICDSCIAYAAAEIQSRCPNRTESIIWFDGCLLGYTNKYFNATGIVPRVNLWDGESVSASDLDKFNQTLFRLLNGLTEAASSNSSQSGGRKFATAEGNFNSSSSGRRTTLYGLAQCSAELTNGQCEECLRNAVGTIATCCVGKGGARALFAWCTVRYESFKFYGADGTRDSPPLFLPPSPSSSSQGKKKSGLKTIVLIVVLSAVFIIVFCLACYFLRRRSSRTRMTRNTLLRENFGVESDTLESLQFSLATIEAATNKFSLDNKVGKGGFGEVYKGILSNGQEIAVKKLSENSRQGVLQFKNEILLIAKLQHRNLVTLLGFCLEEQEKMLIYEFVPNKSLDYFLFDPQRSRPLNWYERYKIIQGIARGILYLHEHSRLKVIHRDLKPSNVLLDKNMNPKISDFGIAKKVALEEDQGITGRVVGTFGYMSPEYMKCGHFSEKSDVFSFGVIVLEVISAKRSRYFKEGEDNNLLSYAWRVCRDEAPLELLDQDIKESCNESEAIKCIQIGLLCVQENPDDRPTMTKVVSYLNSPLTELQFPTNSMHKGIVQRMAAGESSLGSAFSVNDMSTSKVIPW